MPADILLYALIAAVLIFWLRSILGTRDDDEESGSLLSDDDRDGLVPPLGRSKKEDSNVVALNAVMGHGFNLPRHVRIDNKTAENMLEEIAKNHSNFDFHHFIEGAQFAFPMIIEAFADGDKETLKEVLAKSVYDAFSEAIDEREERGEKVETEVKAVEKIDVIDALVKGDMLYITLRYTARETCVIRDRSGEIISGDPDSTTQMIDVWIFGRDLSTDEPEWHLYETRDDEVEEHKTPVPEAGKEKD